jgi:hypothetical protein
MLDWESLVGHGRLQCQGTGREIAPGETYISVLRYTDGGIRREDYAEEAWSAVSSTTHLAWWRRRRPPPAAPTGPRLINHRVLSEIFHRLKDSADRSEQCFLWIITLLLVRARRLRYVDLVRDADGTYLLVREMQDGRPRGFRIRDPRLSDEETARLQEEVARLFAEGAEDHSGGGGGDDNNRSGGGSSPQPPAE